MTDREAALAPPWVVVPDRKPDSLFWRMGAPEEHLAKWFQFFLQLDGSQRKEYLEAHAAPPWWRESIEMSVRNHEEVERVLGIKKT